MWLRRGLVGVREAIAVVVVGVIAAATVLTGSLGGEALARVERSVQLNWRPVYDLIVIPSGADVTRRVGGESVLQANFMASLPNGITMKQWRRIRDLPGVDVAAPVANVGYFSRNQNYYTVEDLSTGIYSVDRWVWWDSGVDRRLAGHTRTDPIPGHVDDCAEDQPFVIQDKQGNIAKESTLEDLVTGFDVGLPRAVEHPATWHCLGLDPGGVFTVFGIDPVQEDRLVGLDEAMTDGKPLQRGLAIVPANYGVERGGQVSPVNDIPMLMADEEWLRSTFRVQYSRWNTDPYELGDFLDQATTADCARRVYRKELFAISHGFEQLPARCIDRRLQARLASAPKKQVLTVDLPAPAGRSLVAARYRDGRWRTKASPGIEVGRYWVAPASDQDYESTPDAPAGDWVGGVRAVPTGSYGPEPTYRQQLPVRRNLFLRYDEVGTYDPDQVADQFSQESQWLPEGTYQVPRAVARFDAAGNPVDPVQLRPTGNPLGYLVQPPQALTTLRAARQLLGKAPISSIRVRLSGVARAGEESWQRIEERGTSDTGDHGAAGAGDGRVVPDQGAGGAARYHRGGAAYGSGGVAPAQRGSL